jgi:outer membrane protein insertion porin family
MMSGCLGTKHLKDNQKMLFRQHIQAPKGINTDELKDLYVQRANRRFLGLTIYHLVLLNYWGEKHYDKEKFIQKKEASDKKFADKIAATTSKKKIDNLNFRKLKKSDKYSNRIEYGNLRMQWGEPISVYDSASVQLTSDRFKQYLFSKGYFRNEVNNRVKINGKYATILYTLKPGPGYRLDSILYQIQDTAMARVVSENNQASLLHKGDLFEQDNLTKERERLDLLMKDHGYYDFSRQYIDFPSDTSMLGDHRVAMIVNIKVPAKRGYHKKFAIDDITFTTDAGATATGTERQKRNYRDIQYQYYKDNYNLRILSQRIFLKKGDLYSRTNTFNTQRQLGNVEAFKFVNINYDTSNGKFIANVFTSPLDQYEWSNEAGVNVTQGFPGPFYNLTFRKRNLFRGMELLDINGRYGFEGVAAVSRDEGIYKSTVAGVNATLTFPQFIWFLKESRRFKVAKYNPKTKFNAGYSYTKRPEYTRTNISVSTTYTWSNQRKQQYFFTPISLSVINSSLDPSFEDELKRQDSLGNYSLFNSFKPSFVNSMIIGSTWNFNNYGNKEKTSSYLRTQLESGGTLWNILNPEVVTKQGLQYFKYLRLNIDFRRNHVIDQITSVAYRVDGGVAYSYGSNKSLPYEKFFFSGGSNSIRAWRPRRLGQGSFKPQKNESIGKDPVKNGYFDYSFEQPSEILLEASIEFRRKIFGFVEGAVFIDAGNVWLFEPRKKEVNGIEVANGNSKFKLNQFYKEIAVGTGFGLRFDFSFLILRLDVGIKMYDPARDKGERFVLGEARFWNPYATKNVDSANNATYSNYREPVIYNVGIGYPF